MNPYTKHIFFVLSIGLAILASCKANVESSELSSESKKATSPKKATIQLPDTLPDFANEKERLDFLQGKFQAGKYLEAYKNPVGDTRQHYLLPVVLKQYKKMIQAFEEDTRKKYPNYKRKIFIVSSFRDYYLQKRIWEGKYTGRTKMRESVKGKTPNEIIDLIMQYSSAPGTSRHHWGTDMDLNYLNNSYFEAGGSGEVIYEWMTENAHKFGFCQPYNQHAKRNNKGYFEEKWHWSYKPVSSRLRKEWLSAYETGKISKFDYLGFEHMGDRAPLYVGSVSKDCL